MFISLKNEVHCRDGVGGHCTAVVLDPQTLALSHIVVKLKSHGHVEVLVPVALLAEGAAKEMTLNCDRDELGQLQPLMKTVRVSAEGLDELNAEGMMHAKMQGGLASADFEFASKGGSTLVEMEAIPDNEVSVRHGVSVQAFDGHGIGQLDAFMLDAAALQISHAVLQEGHLWGKREIAIPSEYIDRIGELGVYLNQSKEFIEQLPQI